jgi:hypothetical protein
MGSHNLINYTECSPSSSVLQMSLKWYYRQLTPLVKYKLSQFLSLSSQDKYKVSLTFLMCK